MPNNTGKPNQDSYIISPNINKKSWQHYFGVCDGHGVFGHLVSAFIKNQLPTAINRARNLDKNPEDGLFKAFHATMEKLVLESKIDLTFSGSTVVGCYLLQDKLYCCNVGDSRAIIGSYDEKTKKWSSKALSNDHKPTVKE
jgi:serine/threonine protein phosphatase PrpC